MTGFEALKTSDLILCINLLQADARSWEEMSDDPEHQHLLKTRAADRRELANRMHSEVQSRDSSNNTN